MVRINLPSEGPLRASGLEGLIKDLRNKQAFHKKALFNADG